MINLLDLGTITSGYGYRVQPKTGASSNHKGIDIVLKNKNIPAVLGGTVEAAGYSSSAGNYIKIKQTDDTTATYMHLSSLNVKTGDTVSEGQIIGVEGSTGISTGTHLHYQVERAGQYINPEYYFETGLTSSGLFTGDKDSGNIVTDIASKIIQILAVVLILILAAFLFMKAFDISIL